MCPSRWRARPRLIGSQVRDTCEEGNVYMCSAEGITYIKRDWLGMEDGYELKVISNKELKR